MSKSLDPNQTRRLVGPDLGPNCLPRLSADDTGRQRVNFYPVSSLKDKFSVVMAGCYPDFLIMSGRAFFIKR